MELKDLEAVGQRSPAEGHRGHLEVETHRVAEASYLEEGNLQEENREEGGCRENQSSVMYRMRADLHSTHPNDGIPGNGGGGNGGAPDINGIPPPIGGGIIDGAAGAYVCGAALNTAPLVFSECCDKEVPSDAPMSALCASSCCLSSASVKALFSILGRFAWGCVIVPGFKPSSISFRRL